MNKPVEFYVRVKIAMKPKLLLCLALVLSGVFLGVAQQIPDPSIRELYQIHVPTKLSVRQINGVLHIQGDRSSLELTNLTVGTNMMMAMWCDVYVYPAGSSHPTNYCHNLEPDVGAVCPDVSVAKDLSWTMETYYWWPDGMGIAVPRTAMAPWNLPHEGGVVAGAKYNVEMDLTIFETDDFKVSRSWNPRNTKYYKILWQRTLKQAFE
jgi:hypothetical protein